MSKDELFRRTFEAHAECQRAIAKRWPWDERENARRHWVALLDEIERNDWTGEYGEYYAERIGREKRYVRRQKKNY